MSGKNLDQFFNEDPEIVCISKDEDFVSAIKPLLKSTILNAYKIYAGNSKPDASSVTGRGPIIEKIIQYLHQETEYPVEMLKADKSLEDDLGIDSITQAEVLATLRDEYNLPFEENFRLRDYPTIEAWADYLVKRIQG